ncbi:MAG: hypothetical protein FWE36_06945 [Erysipelotrichales bacterium]|nr:hypothetical protein [Erysipelotrichales bacterium]
MKLKKITACLDMYGCPNRCKHCWLAITPNGNLTIEDLKFTYQAFRPFTDDLEIVSNYREEDYAPNYKELWNLTSELSDSKTTHFENISYWRAVRDSDYIPWLYTLGVRAAQLTVFGDENTTDFFVGRKGAFKEIIKTIEQLVQNRISPRIQMFIYKNNIDQLPFIEKLLVDLNLEERCKSFDKQFSFFLHQGSCSGENAQFYEDWITNEEIKQIPEKLLKYTFKHFNTINKKEIWGSPEKEVSEKLALDDSTLNIVNDTPVFYVDNKFNVYPNFETPSEIWLLGNLKTMKMEEILKNYLQNTSLGQKTLAEVSTAELVREFGNYESNRLFGECDYKNLLLHKYCRRKLSEKQ